MLMMVKNGLTGYSFMMVWGLDSLLDSGDFVQ